MPNIERTREFLQAKAALDGVHVVTRQACRVTTCTSQR